MTGEGPLGRIYSLHEAADYLRVTKHAIARVANRHGIGTRFGRDLRFSGEDVKAIWEAMRTRPTGILGHHHVSQPFAEEKAWASLRKMAEAKRNAILAERQRRKEAGQRQREEALSEKAARLLTNGKRPKKPNL